MSQNSKHLFLFHPKTLPKWSSFLSSLYLSSWTPFQKPSPWKDEISISQKSWKTPPTTTIFPTLKHKWTSNPCRALSYIGRQQKHTNVEQNSRKHNTSHQHQLSKPCCVLIPTVDGLLHPFRFSFTYNFSLQDHSRIPILLGCFWTL
jgi:hypothetical protein